MTGVMALPLKYWHPLWTTPLSPAMADSSPAEGSVFDKKTQILYIVTFTSSLFNKKVSQAKLMLSVVSRVGLRAVGTERGWRKEHRSHRTSFSCDLTPVSN